MVFFMAVLLFVNIMIVFYVEALRKNEKEKYLAELTEQHYHLQIEYYQQLLEKQQETKALWHDIKKYTTAMQAVAAQNDSEQLRQIAQAAADAYERVKDICWQSCGRCFTKSISPFCKREPDPSSFGYNNSRSSRYLNIVVKCCYW